MLAPEKNLEISDEDPKEDETEKEMTKSEEDKILNDGIDDGIENENKTDSLDNKDNQTRNEINTDSGKYCSCLV